MKIIPLYEPLDKEYSLNIPILFYKEEHRKLHRCNRPNH